MGEAVKILYRRDTDSIGPSELSLGKDKPVNNHNHVISAPWPIIFRGSLPKDTVECRFISLPCTLL